MEKEKSKKKWMKFFFVEPWILIGILVLSACMSLICFLGVFKQLNYRVPASRQLQYVEGMIDNFAHSPGRNNVFFELSLEDGNIYYLNENIVYYFKARKFLPLRRGQCKGAEIELWLDTNYKDHMPNQIYAVNINNEEYLSYEESSVYLLNYYCDSVKSGIKFILALFMICIFVSVSLAVQLYFVIQTYRQEVADHFSELNEDNQRADGMFEKKS